MESWRSWPRRPVFRFPRRVPGVDNAAFDSDHRGMGAVPGGQFGQDPAHVSLDGSLRDRKLRGHLFIRVALRDVAQHFHVALSERIVD